MVCDKSWGVEPENKAANNWIFKSSILSSSSFNPSHQLDTMDDLLSADTNSNFSSIAEAPDHLPQQYVPLSEVFQAHSAELPQLDTPESNSDGECLGHPSKKDVHVMCRLSGMKCSITLPCPGPLQPKYM